MYDEIMIENGNEELNNSTIKLCLDYNFNEIMEKYNDRLYKISMKDHKVLTELGNDLLSYCGVVFNIFQYDEDYINNPLILKSDIPLDEKVETIPVGYLNPVYIGTEEIDLSMIETKKIKYCLNFVNNKTKMKMYQLL